MRTFKKNERGFSLTEVAIVLGVAAIIFSAIWVSAGKVQADHKVLAVQQQMMTLVQNIRQHYGNGTGRLPGKDNEDITTMVDRVQTVSGNTSVSGGNMVIVGLFPLEMRKNQRVLGDKNSFTHAAGGAFHLFRISSTVMRVQLLGLTKPSCVNLLMKFPVLMPEAGVVRLGTAIGMTNVDIIQFGSSNPGNPVPVPLSAVNAALWCANPSNEVDIDFKLVN